MKTIKRLLMMLVALIATTGAWAQTFDFDNSTMQGWTTIDADGDGYTWVLGSQIGGIYLQAGASLEGTGHNSSADMVCSGSFSNAASAALFPDNYLVSPQIKLGGTLTFYACGQDVAYVSEHFGVAVSIAGNTSAADFTTIQQWTMTAAPSLTPALNAPQKAFRSTRRAQGNWYQYTVDLSDYAGQTGYVAIRHFGCSDMFILDIDDIELSNGDGAVPGAGFALEGISKYGAVTFLVNGKEVKKAEAGQTVTAVVTPDKNYVVDDVVAHAFVDWDQALAPQNIGIFKDVELTAAGENTWTFTMPAASVEFLVSYMKDVQLSLASGDITAAVEEAAEGLPIHDLTLTLKSGSEYTINKSLTAAGKVNVNGSGATVDASALEDPFIVLDGTKEFAPKADGTDSDHKYVASVKVTGLTLTGLTNSFIKDAQKTLLEELIVDNSVIEMPASNKNFIDFSGKGYVGLVKVTKSTIWAKDKNTGFFAQYGSRPKNVDGNLLQQFDVQNSTIVNIANGKNFCDLKQNGTAQNVYFIIDNIFAECGKSGQVVVGFNKGQSSATPVWDVTGNEFIWNGECVSDAEIAKAGQKDGEDIVKDCVCGDPGFKDAANGDFTLFESSQPCKFRIGDPRWLPLYKPTAITPAIDVTVPANLGVMDGEEGPTDLFYFLTSYYKESENPAYIKLTLEPEGEYVISEPLAVITAIEILGDEKKPATIDASQLGAQPFVKIFDQWRPTEDPDENDFYHTIYNVAFKNINVKGLKGQVFYANKQKYLLPYLTVDNCQFRMEGATNKTFFDFNGGGFVEDFTINNSTLSADDATKWSNGGFFSTQSGTTFAACGAEKQSFTLTNNTFYNVAKGKTLSTLRENSKNFMYFTVLNNIVVNSGKKNEFVTGLNAGSNSKTPNWLVQYNSFQWTDDNKIFTDISASTTTKASNVPIAANVEGEIAFIDDPAAGNYSLGACEQKVAKIGDPRWLDATIKVTDDSFDDTKDLAQVINEGMKNGFSKFELEANTRYEVKQTIVADKALVITGENVKIDVKHADAFIVLSKTPAVEYLPNSEYYGISQLMLKGLTVTGLKNSIIYDNNTKYCVVDLTIDDCVLGLETEAVQNEALIAFQAGGAKDFTIKNSTVYGNNAVAKYFIRYNNSARLDRYGFDKDTEFQTMTYLNNTFYGLLKSDGQWGNYNGISGQVYSKFDIEKNIWYNSSKDIIRRLAGGRINDNAPLTFDKNTYFNEDTDISASEANYDKSGTALTTNPYFKNPADANFTLSAYSMQCVERTGDPRWFINGGHYNTGIENVEAQKVDDGAWYTIQGVRVNKPAKGVFIHNGKKVVMK